MGKADLRPGLVTREHHSGAAKLLSRWCANRGKAGILLLAKRGSAAPEVAVVGADPKSPGARQLSALARDILAEFGPALRVTVDPQGFDWLSSLRAVGRARR